MESYICGESDLGAQLIGDWAEKRKVLGSSPGVDKI